ncbi:hypothetical protein B0G83_13012 [Paraburkholderia sp. BL21I4N1]|nr:hypothetical protein B0G83_13012 [Paraburkholderia sp. BL21I4N1]
MPGKPLPARLWKNTFPLPILLPIFRKTRFSGLWNGLIHNFTSPKHGSNPAFSIPLPLPATNSQTEIIPEPIDLMHPFVQNRDDADVAVRKKAPIDEMVFVTKEIALNAEFRRNGT